MAGTKYKPIQWGIEAASREFGCDGETLSKAMKRAGLEPAFKSGKFSTSQVVSALFGDYDAQRTRKVTHEANLLEINEKKARSELVEMRAIIEVMQRGLGAMTSSVMGLTDLPIEHRETIIKQIRAAGESVVESVGSGDAAASLHS